MGDATPRQRTRWRTATLHAAGALSLLLMPFGLEGWALQMMGWGCDLLLWVAHWVADWPGAIAVLPSMPALVLPLVAVGLLWLGMARGHWRGLGAGAIAMAIASAWLVPRPDVLVSPSGKLVAFRTPDGQEHRAAVSSGMIKVEDNTVLMLVDSAERPEDIDANRARLAEERAREELLQKRSLREYRMAEANLARALNRLRVSGSEI